MVKVLKVTGKKTKEKTPTEKGYLYMWPIYFSLSLTLSPFLKSCSLLGIMHSSGGRQAEGHAL